MSEVHRLLSWRRGERVGPRRLHVVLTERCNLRCLSCHGGEATHREDEVEDARLVAVTREAVQLGVEELYLVGGEVFVRRRLALRLMGVIKRAGRIGDLTTNGTRLDAETVRRIVGMEWDRLQVSLDGPDAATNDSLRPPAGSFDATVAGLRRLERRKRRVGSDLPRLTLTTVVSRHNAHLMSAMVELAAEHGAAEVTFQSLREMSPLCPELHVPDADRGTLDRAAREAQRAAATHGLLTNAGNFRQATVVRHIGHLDEVMRRDVHDVDDPLLGAHCFVPWTTMVVHVDGKVSPCWEWDGPELGNVKTSTLTEIWHGDVFGRWRGAFAERQVPAHCAQCCLGFLDHTRWTRLTALLQDRQFETALGVAGAILAEDPHHRDATAARATALFGLGRTGDAERWIRDSVARAPEGGGRSPAYLLRLLCDAGRHEAALELADVILADRAPPGRGPAGKAHQARIRALYALGRRDGARRALAAMTSDPAADPAAAAELLFEAHRAGDHEFLVDRAGTLLGRHPDQAYALWVRGAARGKLGDLDGALADVTAAARAPELERVGFDDAIHDTLAELYLERGAPERAIEHAARALALCPGKSESASTLDAARRKLSQET